MKNSAQFGLIIFGVVIGFVLLLVLAIRPEVKGWDVMAELTLGLLAVAVMQAVLFRDQLTKMSEQSKLSEPQLRLSTRR